MNKLRRQLSIFAEENLILSYHIIKLSTFNLCCETPLEQCGTYPEPIYNLGNRALPGFRALTAVDGLSALNPGTTVPF